MHPIKLSSNNPDWTCLPNNLLELVLEKLYLLSNCVRVGAVCKPWRYVVLDNRHIIQSRKQLPMLLIPSKNMSNETRSLYSLTHKKTFELRLPLNCNNMISGLSNGWIATVDKTTAINLLNPFTGGTIRLPPVFNVYRSEDKYFVKKVILSDDPYLSPNDYKVIVLNHTSMDVITSGEKKWTHVRVDFSSISDLSDVIVYKGKIYSVDIRSQLLSVVDDNVDSQLQAKIVVKMRSAPYNTNTTYVVKSSGGDLLLAKRFLSSKRTLKFQVFKLVNSSTPDWVEMSLNGDALFLGGNYSVSVLAADFPGCEPNSIYYTDDYWGISPTYYPSTPDMGIFNLEDGSIGQLYNTYPYNIFQQTPSLWVVPTMAGIQV